MDNYLIRKKLISTRNEGITFRPGTGKKVAASMFSSRQKLRFCLYWNNVRLE